MQLQKRMILVFNIVILLFSVAFQYDVPSTCAKYAKVVSGGFSDGNLFTVSVNNQDLGVAQKRGWNLVVFDKYTGAIVDQQNFDTFAHTNDNKKMIDYITTLESGTPVVFGIKDEASTRMNDYSYLALDQLGARDIRIKFRDSYAGVFIKGSYRIEPQSQKHKEQHTGQAVAYGCIVNCHQKCETCLDERENCLSCVQHFTREAIAPACTCLKGYYNQGSNLSCSLCSSSCNIDCIDSPTNCCDYKCGSCQTTITNCTECSHSTRHNPPTCDCRPGYYESGPYKTCSSCVFPCVECESQFQCLTCVVGQFRNDIPLCDCQEGYYSSGEPDCQPCEFPCVTCKDQVTCNICVVRENANLAPDCTCQEGFYENDSLECVRCADQCATCTDFDDCVGCARGYYVNSENICAECSYPCDSCINGNICVTCRDTLNRNTETCECLDGYFDNGNLCQECQKKCTTCSNYNTCLTCAQSYPSRNIQKNCACIAGYGDGPDGSSCIEIFVKVQQLVQEDTGNYWWILFIFIGIISLFFVGIFIFYIFKKIEKQREDLYKIEEIGRRIELEKKQRDSEKQSETDKNQQQQIATIQDLQNQESILKTGAGLQTQDNVLTTQNDTTPLNRQTTLRRNGSQSSFSVFSPKLRYKTRASRNGSTIISPQNAFDHNASMLSQGNLDNSSNNLVTRGSIKPKYFVGKRNSMASRASISKQ